MTQNDDQTAKITGSHDQTPTEQIPEIVEVPAYLTLFAKTFDGQILYSFKDTPIVGGPCDGKPDRSSCGDDCTCRSGQPWYGPPALARMGIRVKLEEKEE